MYKFVLASQSPRRKELLNLLGIEYICHPSNKEEITSKTKPEEVVKELAHQKAEDIAQFYDKNTVIIAADTIVAFQNEIMGKPKDEADAFRMLNILQGEVHEVFTGVTIVVKENGNIRTIEFVEKTEVFMWEITPEQIRTYIATKEPMDKAGAYAIQGLATKFVKKINGDYNNVVGLPISRLYKELLKWNLIIDIPIVK